VHSIDRIDLVSRCQLYRVVTTQTVRFGQCHGSVYGFMQALMREVAYDSLALSRRQALQAAPLGAEG